LLLKTYELLTLSSTWAFSFFFNGFHASLLYHNKLLTNILAMSTVQILLRTSILIDFLPTYNDVAWSDNLPYLSWYMYCVFVMLVKNLWHSVAGSLQLAFGGRLQIMPFLLCLQIYADIYIVEFPLWSMFLAERKYL